MSKMIVLSITLMVSYVGIQFIGGAVSAVSNCINSNVDCKPGYRSKYIKAHYPDPTFYGDFDR